MTIPIEIWEGEDLKEGDLIEIDLTKIKKWMFMLCTIEGEEVLEAIVDNAGKITLPRNYVGRRVKVIVLKSESRITTWTNTHFFW